MKLKVVIMLAMFIYKLVNYAVIQKVRNDTLKSIYVVIKYLL